MYPPSAPRMRRLSRTSCRTSSVVPKANVYWLSIAPWKMISNTNITPGLVLGGKARHDTDAMQQLRGARHLQAGTVAAEEAQHDDSADARIIAHSINPSDTAEHCHRQYHNRGCAGPKQAVPARTVSAQGKLAIGVVAVLSCSVSPLCKVAGPHYL